MIATEEDSIRIPTFLSLSAKDRINFLEKSFIYEVLQLLTEGWRKKKRCFKDNLNLTNGY